MAVMAKHRRKKKLAKGTGRNPWPRTLAQFRERHRLTQAEAAALARVGVRSWIRWENGDLLPSDGYAQLLTLTIESHDRKNQKNR